MGALAYIHQAHLMAVGAADEDAAAELTVLINALEGGDEPTTGTTGTTGSDAAVSTIMEETGIVPSGHQRAEHDVIVEVKRLRGELNAKTELAEQYASEVEARRTETQRVIGERDAAYAAYEELRRDHSSALDELGARVDPDHYTVDGLRHIASQRGIDTGDASTKAELADAINNNPAGEAEEENE